MRTRRAETDLTWNGAAVTSKMVGYKATVTYTDAASGEADSLEISMNDRDRQWTTAWMPKTGDTLTAAIKVYDWEREGDNRTLDCGFFILDNYSFSWWPMTGTISAVSVPADSAFRATQRTKTWEKATLQAIGNEIAARAGITLTWDVEGEPITVPGTLERGAIRTNGLRVLYEPVRGIRPFHEGVRPKNRGVRPGAVQGAGRGGHHPGKRDRKRFLEYHP